MDANGVALRVRFWDNQMDQTVGPLRGAAYHHGDLRTALLRAGEKELEEKGVEGFTLRGCAKRAGVSHAAPAHHFGDADGLLTALAAAGFERFTAAMRARAADAESQNFTPLEAAALGYVDFALANPALFRLMFSSSRPDLKNEELCAKGDVAFAMLVDSVAEARNGNPWDDRAGPADVAAAWALAHGLADLLLSGRLGFLQDPLEVNRDKIRVAVIGRLKLLGPGGASAA